MCVPVRGHRGELGDRRSRRVDLEASRDAAGPERLPGSREAVRRASSRSDNSLTEQSASDRSPAHAGPSTARGRPRSEASFEKVIRTSTLSTTAASHRTQRGGRESNSSWRGRDPPKTSQLELVTAGRASISDFILPTCRALPPLHSADDVGLQMGCSPSKKAVEPGGVWPQEPKSPAIKSPSAGYTSPKTAEGDEPMPERPSQIARQASDFRRLSGEMTASGEMTRPSPETSFTSVDPS